MSVVPDKLPAHTVVNILSNGGVDFSEEEFLSIASSALMRTNELDSREIDKLKEILASRYSALIEHARSSTLLEVKMVTARVASLLGQKKDHLDLSWEVFQSGNMDSLFETLEYLVRIEDFDRAKLLVLHAFQSFIDGKIAYITQSNDLKNRFIYLLIHSAFFLGLDGLAEDCIQMLEGQKIESDDPRILQYRQIVRSPEEAEFALGKIWNYYKTGEGSYISNELLQSVDAFLKDQIDHLQQHDTIEPQMLSYLTSDNDETDNGDENRDYHTQDGKNFFFLRACYIRAFLFRDADRAYFLMSLLEQNENEESIKILADVCDNLHSHFREDDEKTLRLDYQIAIDVLVHLLRNYGGPEYKEMHSRIYMLLRKYMPNQSEGIIREHQADAVAHHFQLQKPFLSKYYLSINSEMSRQMGYIFQLHLTFLARNKTFPANGFPSSISFVFYILQYILYNHEKPIFDPSVLDQVCTNPDITPLESGFLHGLYGGA